ncbi:unnamed protein product [Miscanthus lutarioriparius]|uniref:Glutathione S-transferase C-terminal domain-containing protein n=1 Tax=Miscanthus lutarioriparius TaxID=422564 RepID=A0A811QIR7_9POAL|nr:unnamed protein product [Miscanthus lutarioriparius]
MDSWHPLQTTNCLPHSHTTPILSAWQLYRTWVPIFRGRTAEERVQAATQVVAVLQTLEQAFKKCSKGKPFFGGDSLGLMDVVLGGHLGWLYSTEAICGVKVVDATKTPLLAGGVGTAVLRAGRCEGADSGRGQACGV